MTAITIGTATAGNGSATVSWTPPATDNGSPILAYVVTAYVGYFPEGKRPARSAFGTSGLALGALIELECQAYAGEK